MRSGATVVIEGTEAEIVGLLRTIDVPENTEQKKVSAKQGGNVRKKKGVSDLLEDLIQEDFFSTPKTLANVQTALEERGHLYTQNNLSTPIVRKVRARSLRRMKKDGNWIYVN